MKDVTVICQRSVVDGELHLNPDRMGQVFNQLFWKETAKGPAIARKLGIRYTYGTEVRQITTDAVPNETVCVHITTDSTEPKAQEPADTITDELKIEYAEGSSNVIFDFEKLNKNSKINFDQQGIIHAMGTQFGNQSWRNPFDSGLVGINFSEDACN